MRLCGYVTFTTVADRRAVELSPPVLTSFVTAGIRTFNFQMRGKCSTNFHTMVDTLLNQMVKWDGFVLNDLIKNAY